MLVSRLDELKIPEGIFPLPVMARMVSGEAVLIAIRNSAGDWLAVRAVRPPADGIEHHFGLD